MIQSIRERSGLFFDVHLMIEEPVRYIEEFKKAGADLITIHVEACSDVKKTIEAVKQAGLKVGLALNPETGAEAVEPYIPLVDMVLVMSVHPGFGGQSLIPETLEKMKKVKAMIQKNNPLCLLEADGGIHLQNVKTVAEAGVNVIVAGTAVFRGDITKNISAFMEVLGNDCDRTEIRTAH